MNADGASAFAASRRASLSGHVDRQQELILGLITCRKSVAAPHIEATSAFGLIVDDVIGSCSISSRPVLALRDIMMLRRNGSSRQKQTSSN